MKEKADKAANKKWEGMTLIQVAEARNQHPVDAFLDVSIEADLKNVWMTPLRVTNLSELIALVTAPDCFPGVRAGGASRRREPEARAGGEPEGEPGPE